MSEASQLEAFHGKKALITGGLGFIGSHLARRLLALGAEVCLVDSLIPEYGGNWFNIEDIRERVKVNISDVRDAHSIRYLVQGQDYLFNLAGQTSHLDSMEDPFTDMEINCGAQLSILEACRKHNPHVNIVFASTRQLYGKPDYLPVDEKHLLRPVDVNGVNKMAGEWFHILYHNVYRLRTCALRLTNTYGPGMRIKDARQTFLGIWIRRLMEGQTIQIFGDGQQLRDFNYVTDVVEAMLRVALSEAAEGKVFNLGSQEVISLKELAKCLVSLHPAGRYELIEFPPERKAIDIGDYYSDYSSIRDAVGWSPRIDLREGLKQTLAYYHQYAGKYY